MHVMGWESLQWIEQCVIARLQKTVMGETVRSHKKIYDR